MTAPETATGSTTNTRSWVLIGVGTLAVALGLWDVLVEQDSGGSLVPIAVGLIAIALGIRRRQSG